MDNLGILIQAILSLKDTTASKNQIAKDLPNLERQLQSDEKARVKIIAGLDTDKSRELIKSQIGTLFNAGNAPTVKIGVDIGNAKNAIGNITNQANVSKSLQIFDSKQLEAEGRKYFTKTTDILDRVKRYYQQNGALKVDITSLETAKGQIQSFTAVVEDSNNVIKHFNYERAKIDTGGKKANYGFAQTDSLKTVDKNAGANLKTTLNFLSKIDEKIMSIQSKATKQSNPLQEGTVYYENYNNKLTETVAKIEEIKNAHTTLSTKQKNEINKMITELDLYRKEQQKLAYPPMISSTSIDDSVKTAQASLTTLEQKWKNQGILTGEFKTQVTALKAELDKVGDTESLKKYNVSLKLAQEQAKQLYQIKRDDITTEDKLRLKFMQKLTKSYTQLISLKNQFAKSTNADNKSIYQTEIAQTEEIIRNLTEQFQTSGLITQVYQEQINQLKHQVVLTDEINKNTAQANATKQSQQAFKNYYNDIQKTTKAVETAISSLNQLNNSTVFRNNSSNPQVTQTKQELVSLRAEYQQLLTQLQANPTSQGLETLRTKLTELDNRMKTAVNSAKVFEDQLRNDNSAEKLARRVQVLKTQIKTYAAANPRAAKQYKTQFEEMYSVLKSNPDNLGLDKVAKQFQNIRYEANQAGLTGKNVFQELAASASKFMKWMSMTYLISTFTRTIRSMVTSVIELDTALVDLKKTFGGTEYDLKNLYVTANQTAKELGVTTKEILEQASAWSRLGYSSAEAAETMAKNSAIFKTISPGMDIDTATDGLVSMMKAFDIEANDVLDGIMSKVNIVGNKFATDNTAIVEAMTRSSSAMAAANNTLEETIALNTASIEITRNAETTATAWRTVSMRLRGYDEETEELSDDLKNITGDIANLTKTASNGGRGISLFTDESRETYKSTYQIIKEIAAIWDELSDKNQAELLEKLAGKRNSQVVSAAINNFASAEKAIDEMANSQGNAMAEMEIAYDSIAYKVNEFKESLVGLGQTIFEQDALKWIIDKGTTIIEVLDKIVEKIGLLPTILGGIAFKNIGSPKMFGLILKLPIVMCVL